MAKLLLNTLRPPRSVLHVLPPTYTLGLPKQQHPATPIHPGCVPPHMQRRHMHSSGPVQTVPCIHPLTHSHKQKYSHTARNKNTNPKMKLASYLHHIFTISSPCHSESVAPLMSQSCDLYPPYTVQTHIHPSTPDSCI